MADEYMSFEDRLELGLASFDDMPDIQPSLMDQQPVQTEIDDVPEITSTGESLKAEAKTETVSAPGEPKHDARSHSAKPSIVDANAPLCSNCGNITQRSGSCYVCTACGTTSGCS